MSYILKHFNTNLLIFNVEENLADPLLKILWVNEEKKHLLPLGMEISEKGLSSWIKHRSIPKNRAYVHAFLAKSGLNANRPMDVIAVCKGLSLNDAYWVVEESFEGTFENNNLYHNPFSRILAWTAFTGYGSSIRSTFQSSPEFTTNGMLPKCWRRIAGEIYLYKGATSGASNTGCEPYSELYAYQIGKALDFNVVPYKISQWKGNLCSVCQLFTSEETAYVPIGRIVRSGGMKAVRAFYASLGKEYITALNEMIVFDALIYNSDRHYGNFGVLVDNRTNKIKAPAPLFDHGNALFNFAGSENWQNKKALEQYANTLLPCVYEDYVEEAKKVMNNELRAKLRKCLNIEIQKTGRYNYSKVQLELMSEIIRQRIRILIS